MGWTMPRFTMTDGFDAAFGVDEWHGTARRAAFLGADPAELAAAEPSTSHLLRACHR
jgi:hypothetical protein